MKIIKSEVITLRWEVNGTNFTGSVNENNNGSTPIKEIRLTPGNGIKPGVFILVIEWKLIYGNGSKIESEYKYICNFDNQRTKPTPEELYSLVQHCFELVTTRFNFDLETKFIAYPRNNRCPSFREMKGMLNEALVEVYASKLI